MKKKHGLLTLPLVALAVLALALTSAGGASAAGGLTRHQVKKIATKVVTDLAPGLSVAHADSAHNADFATNSTNATNANHATSATSADNATTLAGQPSSAYLNQTYFFSPPGTETGSSAQPRHLRTYSLSGLPSGNYLFTYDLNLNLSAQDVVVECFIRTRFNQAFTNQAVGNSVVDAPSASSTPHATISGSFLVNVGTDQPKFYCGAASPSQGGSANPAFSIHRESQEESVSSMEFTRIDDIQGGTITEDNPPS